MIPVNESFDFICSTLGIVPENIKSMGHKKKESFNKRIIQVLLRDHYGKNVPYQFLADRMGLNVASVFEGIESANLWIKVNYEPFTVPFRHHENLFNIWITEQYRKKCK